MLAVVGLFSLRQDEQAAEQAARKGRPKTRKVSPRHSDLAGEELQQFLTLQNVWMIDLNGESQPSLRRMPPDKDLEAGIAKWERTYPGLRLAALAEPNATSWPTAARSPAPDSRHTFPAKMVL